MDLITTTKVNIHLNAALKTMTKTIKPCEVLVEMEEIYLHLSLSVLANTCEYLQCIQAIFKADFVVCHILDYDEDI